MENLCAFLGYRGARKLCRKIKVKGCLYFLKYFLECFKGHLTILKFYIVLKLSKNFISIINSFTFNLNDKLVTIETIAITKLIANRTRNISTDIGTMESNKLTLLIIKLAGDALESWQNIYQKILTSVLAKYCTNKSNYSWLQLICFINQLIPAHSVSMFYCPFSLYLGNSF